MRAVSTHGVEAPCKHLTKVFAGDVVISGASPLSYSTGIIGTGQTVILFHWNHHSRKRRFFYSLSNDRSVRCTTKEKRQPPKALTDIKAERVAQRILEAEGWTIHRAIKVTYQVKDGSWRSQSTDIWKAIDLLGMHPTKGYKVIQVGTEKGRSARRRRVEALPWPHLEPFVMIEYWETRAKWEGRRARHYFRVHRFDPIAKDLIDDLSKKVKMSPIARAHYLWKVLPDVIEVPREML